MSTTNYEFITPIGSDVVNLLTQSNPNWTNLDSILKGVSDDAIGKATELKTGTVHALTRSTGSEDRDTFVFIATTNFVAGETFLLDNEQVTALTASGEQLSTGCYIIGSAVLVHKKDTLLTFYVPESKAKDSDKLGGELPAHYATQNDMAEVQADITAVETKVGTGVLQTTAQNCVDAINEVNVQLTSKVEITAVAGDTYRSLFTRLRGMIDDSKITSRTTLVEYSGNSPLYNHIVFNGENTGNVTFSRTSLTSSAPNIVNYVLSNTSTSSSALLWTGSGVADGSNNALTVGAKFEFRY